MLHGPGVAYGGGDRATLTVAVVIYDNPAAFSPAMTLAHTVAENDGRVILTGFLDLQLSAVTQVRPVPKLSTSRFHIETLIIYKLSSRKFTRQNDLD